MKKSSKKPAKKKPMKDTLPGPKRSFNLRDYAGKKIKK
jgi:hypothetical protein